MFSNNRVRGDWISPLELLVLQPSPFCNLDCSYCYLPNRNDKRRMSMATLETVVATAAASGWIGPELSIVWHAGEPLVMGTAWYEEAISVVAKSVPATTKVRHQFQTNAVLLNPAWCDLIRRHEIAVGVSIDGPAFLHDARRRTRDGRGTHAKVMRGIAHLRDAGIPFHAICVLSRTSLAHADALFDFFADLGVEQVGFNVEEVEADNTTSTLMNTGVEAELAMFWRTLVARQAEAPKFLHVREIEKVLGALQSPDFGVTRSNDQVTAGRIVTVGWDGAFTTWSPELLGGHHPRHGSLTLAPSLGDGISPRVREHLTLLQDEIDQGIAECRRTCKYFDFCLGGAPANKLGEHGRFDVTETMYCRLTEKVVVDVVLETLDAKLPPSGLDAKLPPSGLDAKLPPSGLDAKRPPSGLDAKLPPSG